MAILEVYIDMILGQTIGMTLRQCCNFVRQECMQVQVLVLISQNPEKKIQTIYHKVSVN